MRMMKFAVGMMLLMPSLNAQKEERVILLVRSDQEKVLNKLNLDQIKAFILKTGMKSNYSNMYGNNPSFETDHYFYYLNPDGGQVNINCDPAKGDFNTLVIRRKASKQFPEDEFRDDCRHINFISDFGIKVEAHYANSKMPISKIREFPEQAVKELLELIAALEHRPATEKR